MIGGVFALGTLPLGSLLSSSQYCDSICQTYATEGTAYQASSAAVLALGAKNIGDAIHAATADPVATLLCLVAFVMVFVLPALGIRWVSRKLTLSEAK